VLSGVLEVLSHEVSDADVGAMEIVDVCVFASHVKHTCIIALTIAIAAQTKV